MSETWHGDSYVEEQESLASSIAQMTPDVQSAKFVSNRVVTEDLNLYISPTGNDTTGDGTQGKPFFSLNRCVEYINSRIMSIADGGRAYIRCEAGVYDYSAEEQSVKCYKPGLRLVIRGAQFNDVTDIYNQLLTKINNSEDPVYTFTGDGVVTTSYTGNAYVSNPDGSSAWSLSEGDEQEVHAGWTIRPHDNTQFAEHPAEIIFQSKRTEFQLGENIMWISGRTTDCSLFDLRISNNDQADTYVLGLQEIFCNEFKRVEIYAKGWGGIQISESKISLMQDVTIVRKESGQGTGLVINKRSDVRLYQTNTIDGFDCGISVTRFSILQSQSSGSRRILCKNCTTGLLVSSVSIAEVSPNRMPPGIEFENCTTDMSPSTTESWSQYMGYVS